MTDYLEIKINVNPLYEEVVAEILNSFGIEEIILSEEYFNDNMPIKNENVVKAYIPENEKSIELIKLIKNDLINQKNFFIENNITEKNLGSFAFTTNKVNDEDWSESWKQYWHPQRIGKHIIICPSWEKVDDIQENDIIINLDPGAAFGTGTHQTTRLCIRAVEKVYSEENTFEKVLDVGTGSGILAIIAAKMGAKEVYGIDIDSVAIEVSIENAQKNSVSKVCHFDDNSLKNINDKYDLVIVNILARTIIMMADDVKKVCKNGGTILLSGIIEAKVNEVIEKYESIGLNLVEKDEEEGWYSLTFNKV